MSPNFPVIYVAIEFYRAPSGKWTFHTHHVAACNSEAAAEILQTHGRGIDFAECYVTTDAVRERDEAAALHTRCDQMRTDEVDDAGLRHWREVMTRESWSGGERVPAAWVRVRAPTKAAA